MSSSQGRGFFTFTRPTVDRKAVLIVLSLIAIFSGALLLRVFPAKYGFFLNEFDPYFDYRSTQFIVDSYDARGVPGIWDYFSWVDNNAWFPEGRNVAPTSQGGLHFAAAILFIIGRDIFGMGIPVYDFVVLLPAFLGALTVFAVFLLGRQVAGTGAGIFTSLIIAFSPPIIQRGTIGWFKSEPLALLVALFGSYLFLAIYDKKVGGLGLTLRAVFAGLLLGYANTAWGGSFYFSIAFSLLLFISPFLKVDLGRTTYGGGLLVSSILIVSSVFPRPGPGFILNPVGILLIFGLGFAVLAQQIRSHEIKTATRTMVKVLFVLGLLGAILLSFNIFSGVTARYFTAINPLQRNTNPLVESVAEHFVPTGADYFSSYFVLLFLGGFGTIIALRKVDIHYAYALLIGISGFYLASSFSRLLVFSSIAIAIMASIGFSELAKVLMKPSAMAILKKKIRVYEPKAKFKIAYSAFAIAIIAFPVMTPSSANWLEAGNVPASIVNGGTSFRAELPDWLDALEWIRDNTPENAVLASWWDYGYWITVMGNRTTLADNATLNSTRIQRIAKMFMSPEAKSVKILKELKGDYVVVYAVGTKFRGSEPGQLLYTLGGGGDESKKQWFIRIGGLKLSDFLYDDDFTPKPNFWDETTLGKMFPFRFQFFIDQSKGAPQVTQEYQQGRRAIYSLDIKYPPQSGKPFRLVYASPSLLNLPNQPAEIFTAVLIYQLTV